MDFKVVALELEDSLDKAIYGSTAILLNHKYALVTSNLLFSRTEKCMHKNDGHLSFLASNDLLKAECALRICYKNDVSCNNYITEDVEVIAVVKNRKIDNATKDFLDDWDFDSPKNSKNFNRNLCFFSILKIKDSKTNLIELQEYLTCWWKLTNNESFNVSDEVLIKSVPFGNKNFLDNCGRGIVSNIVGDGQTLILSDCLTTFGCETGAVYKLNSKTRVPLGLVLSSSLWWRGARTGLTLFTDVRVILSELLHQQRPADTVENISHPRLIDVIGSSLLQIYCGSQWGTAIVIQAEKGILITNSHVINRDQEIKVYWKGYSCSVSLIYKVPDNEIFDVAVIKCDPQFLKQHHLKSIKTANDSIHLNDEVFAAGFSFFPKEAKSSPTISKGYISKLHESMLITSCCVNPGMSGGAVFNRNGLIGVIVCNTKIPVENLVYTRFNMAIPYYIMKNAIQDYLEDESISKLEQLWETKSAFTSPWKKLQSKL